MIQANELRVGNYVYLVDDEAKDSPWLRKVTPSPIDSSKFLEPIQLTPEMLEMCGFENMKIGLIEDTILELNQDGDTYDVFISQEDLGQNVVHHQDYIFLTKASIKYLHQLQNLYFALTGEELTISFSNKTYKKLNIS